MREVCFPALRSFLLRLCRPVNVPQVGTGNVETTDHADHLTLDKACHDGQREEIILYEQFQGPVECYVGSQRFYIASQQVFRQNQRLQRGRLRSKVNFIQSDHTEKPIIAIDHGKNRVGSSAEPVDHHGRSEYAARSSTANRQCGGENLSEGNGQQDSSGDADI